jgi:hypothetical protein
LKSEKTWTVWLALLSLPFLFFLSYWKGNIWIRVRAEISQPGS